MGSLGIHLERSGDVPLGVQLAWALRMRIASRLLATGDRLPGVRELAGETGVNVNTVRSVYARLESEGLIRAEHGRGTFVAESAPADDRLAVIARRAALDAETAGLDPREVAAALYSGVGASPASTSDGASAERRRRLRAEIAVLERELADAQLVRARAGSGARTGRSPGPRILSEHELQALRDDLTIKLARLRRPEHPGAEPSAPPTSRSATRTGGVVRFRLSPGT